MKTKLEWFVGSDKDINHYDAKKWVKKLTVAGAKWRLPTIEELRTLYQPNVGICNIDPLFNDSDKNLWVWSSGLVDNDNKPSKNRNSPCTRVFYFDSGDGNCLDRCDGYEARVFAVRSGRR